MSAIVCGKRSNFFEDLQSPSSSPSSPPIPKRIRCSPSSFSPPRSSANHPSAAAANYFSTQSVIDHLQTLFPDMDRQLLDRAFEQSGGDLDSAIKGLNELQLGSTENLGALTGRSDATQETSPQILTQGNGGPTPAEHSSAAIELHMERTEWVEVIVREVMDASCFNDAKARASRALEVYEKYIIALASEATVKQENIMHKQQLEAVAQENAILKRAVAIQRERQKEFQDRGDEVNQLKQVVAQYQERLRTLEVNNYALTMHLKQAQQGNSIPGCFHPDVF